jgi:hypothetical protein
MKTKKFVLAIILTGSVILGMQSCQKYSDGPLISLNSRTSRVANIWKVDNYKVNDVDLTSLVTDYSETYSTDGNYSYQWGIIGGTGNWVFQNHDEEILITGIENQSTVTLYIQKLEAKQFWYYIMDGIDKKEFHMIQK